MSNNNLREKTLILLVARVSDVQQRDALPAQEKRLTEYASRKKWLKSDYKYIEFDETAHKKNRKTFRQLVIEPLLKYKGNVILVFDKIDRFSRDSSSEEKIELTLLYQSGKLELHFPNDNLCINKDSPAADLFRLDIGVSLAAYYSNAISNNVKRRFEQLLAKGVWVHRAPIGYKNVVLNKDSDSKTEKDILVDEDRAHFVIQAFELRAQGMPYSQIAKTLVKNGFTSRKTGKNNLTKAGVEKIINNKFYYGVMTHSGKEYKHKYKPLIDRALYNKCLLVKDERKDMKTKWRSKDFNFSNILRCGKCGRTVSSFKSKQWVYLKCAKPGCANPLTAESLVLGTMEALIKRISIPNELVPKVIDELKNKHNDQQIYYAKSLISVRQEYDKIDKKLDMWFEKLVDERVTPEKHDKIVDMLTARQEELNDRLNVLTKGNKDFLVTASYLLDLANRVEELYKLADEGQRSKLLGFIVSNLRLNDKKLSYTVNYPFNQLIEEKEKASEDAKTQLWCG